MVISIAIDLYVFPRFGIQMEFEWIYGYPFPPDVFDIKVMNNEVT